LQERYTPFRHVPGTYFEALRGHRTASGEPFNPDAFTAAHRSLALGTCMRVENARNGRSVRVRVNDRGPFVKGRIVDVSQAAARALDFLREGVARVRLFLCA
jgi:peptidoglycan lytic transglycosylase